jgi:tetratricopeptide (TPR) repeat protein
MRRKLGNAGAVARSQLALGKLLLDRGRPEEAEAMVREAAREFERSDSRDFAAEALTAMAAAAWDAGRRDEARKALERARELAVQSRDASVSLYFALVEARLASAAGDLAQGESRLRAALAGARGAGLPLEMEARLLLARIRLASGPPGVARAELAALLAEAEKHGIALVSRQARDLLNATGPPARL